MVRAPASHAGQEERPRFDLPRIKSPISTFIDYRKSTKGLTENGEYWLREGLSTALQKLPPVEQIQRQHLVDFLAGYQSKPWRRHSFYRVFKTFFKWVSQTYQIPNPMVDQFGNSVIEPPKVPQNILNTVTPEEVEILIEAP